LPGIQTLGWINRVLTLRMPYIEDSEARRETIDAINSQLEQTYGISEIQQEEQVGSEWGREVSRKALIGLGVFLVVILIYITIRLDFKMAVSAIVALMHDTLITVGIYALTSRQVTPVTVIAFLTILGYSLYDTIVVFDRVEENTNLQARAGKLAYFDIVNESVNQTLMRSFGTTLTTLLPIITILIFGGDTLKDFAFALFLGVLLGGYSSIFIACPVLTLWREREPRYAAVREKVESRGGAKEAILISSPRSKQEAASARRSGEEVTSREKGEGAATMVTKPEGKEKPKPAVSKAPASKKAASAAGTKKKKATTKGPGGGKKKKKKKKKK
jgi:SecD/SecF fusion protein